jgi:hypothetical protein
MRMTPQRSPIQALDPTAPTTIAGAARVAGWGLLFWGAVQLAAVVLERQAAALALVQAGLAEWGAGRMGIAWSDPLAPMPTSGAIARRAARGAALGSAAAAVVILIALATRGAAMVPNAPSVGLLGIGLFASTLGAVRDELLLRGVVLRMTRGLLPTWVSLVACGAAAAAARFGVDGLLTASVAAEALRGIALGALWVHDRGAWMACAANASWMWTLGSIAHGGLVDVRFATEPDGGTSGVVVLAAAAIVAAISLRRRSSEVVA